MKAVLIHRLIEVAPAAAYCGLIAVGLISTEVSTKTIVLLVVWARYGIQILNLLGLVKLIFGLELITGNERGITIGLEIPPVVTAVLKIDRPENLADFRDKTHRHFMG